ncbi:MAG TPA: cell division protein FtsL, partial [Alicycliphilus sp.]|nr:cell division protein FtsL [Alicycliphilus sp.]
EKMARAQLNMRTATPAITHYVTADGKPVAAPLAAPAAAGGRR